MGVWEILAALATVGGVLSLLIIICAFLYHWIIKPALKSLWEELQGNGGTALRDVVDDTKTNVDRLVEWSERQDTKTDHTRDRVSSLEGEVHVLKKITVEKE